MDRQSVDSIVELAATVATKADEFDQVLVLCIRKLGGGYSIDNGVTIQEAIFMVESFKHWVLTKGLN